MIVCHKRDLKLVKQKEEVKCKALIIYNRLMIKSVIKYKCSVLT